ncbi:MAG: metallophosphoesterase [Ruminococcus sp.]|nr:metallophosphoesterase [Ruminococcus sp.]
MKNITKRSLAIVLSALMLIAYLPMATFMSEDAPVMPSVSANTYSAVSGTSGDATLFEKVEDTSASIESNKDNYTVGEPIYITANNGNWVGLYRADQTDYANTKSIFWYYVSGNEGEAVDIRTGVYNADNPLGISPSLFVGPYTAVLFSSADASSPVASVTFNVTDANGDTDNANNYITTNKHDYYYGETVVVTAKSSNNASDQAWVGVYNKGDVPSSSVPALHWYYLVSTSKGRNWQGASLSLYGASTDNANKALSPGEYDVYLFGDSGYSQIQAQTTISIVGGTVETDKSNYGLGEDIIVTAASCTEASSAWVGIYKKSELGNNAPGSTIPSRSWYYLSAHSGRSVVLQDLAADANGTPLKDLEAGEYILYLFGDSGYSDIQDYKTITVEDSVNTSFSNGAYRVDDLNDGFANGSVALEISPDSVGAIGNTDTALYWADIEGKPLADYTALAKTKINSNIVVFDMYSHTFIPEEAEALVAYISYKGTEGKEGYFIPLPTGTVTYSGLDKNILSEFQMVSDLHITSDKATSVDGGNLIDQYYHVNDNEHFEMMLKDIARNSPDSSGIFVNGDIANNGLKVEFDQVNSLYEAADGTLPQMYVSLGNHDSYPGDITEFVNYANTLGAGITTDAPYYSKDINGYKYIFLAGDNDDYYGLYSANPNSNDAELSTTQLQWLDAELAENEANGGKPVFVMLHQAIANTVAGSFDGQDWDGVVNIDDFKAILNKYNNVILLGGHSHWEINSPNNMFPGSADLPVAINTASVGYLWSDYSGVAGGEWIEGSQGFYVRVYEDKVVFLGRDFVNQKWIPSACYVIYNEDVSASSLTMNVDDVMSASEYLTNIKNRSLTFSTSDKNIVQVDENGTLTATGIGTAFVTIVAAPSNSEVVTRDKIAITVTNESISEDIKEELGDPLNLGDDFSAYIGYSKDGNEYYLTIPSDDITFDRNSSIYTTSQGFQTQVTGVSEETIYYPEFIEKNNAVFSVRQFWDFERQEDGSYMIFNTWTNATHNKSDAKASYALDGGSYSYYKDTMPVEENDVDNGLVATRFYFNQPSYTEETGEYTNYYRWFIYQDNEGNYYLKNKHTGFVLSILDDVYSHYFGQMGKMFNEEQMTDSALFLDRIASNDNIKMSLFDYGKYINNNSYIAREARKFRENGVSSFDANANDNILWFNQDAWNPEYVVDGVATLEESLKDSDDITVDNIGNPSQYDSTPLMLNSLDSTGYPFVNNVTYHDWDRRYGDFDNSPAFGSDSGSLKYLFDQEMTYVTGDSNEELTAENYADGYYQSVRYDVGDAYGTGMFKEASTGGMVYSSYMNAAYFDTSEYYTSGIYQPVKGQRFQLYDYVIRPYYHYYYDENTSFTDSQTGVTYHDIYNSLIKSTRLDTFGEDSLFNNRYLRKSLRDYNSYNRNFLPFNYGHNITSDYLTGDYTTASTTGSFVDPVWPDETDTKQRTGYTSSQQDTPNLPAYYNDVYADTTGTDHPNSQETNTWFGMTMEFDFEIANNGQVYDMNGDLHDMVFNFTGDDDVLVYIDNVLVLNVAGTHGAQMATINFATGNVAHPTDESCYPQVGIDTSESSTIREKFETAYAEAAQEGSNSILAGTTLNEDMFEGNTFANGTRHTLKFFYLERGGSRSFNDIYFNMETLPSSGFEVEKQVVDSEGNDLSAEDNSDYTFSIVGYTEDGDVLTSGIYTYDVVDIITGAVVASNQTVKQGNTFTIKGGQKALFKDLDVATQYTVTEIADPCTVKGIRTYLNDTEIENMATQQEHLISCTAGTYIPVLENDTTNITFVNTIEYVTVNIKYYDREVISGLPADMGDEPKTFAYGFYGSDIIFTDEEHTAYDTESMIAEAGMALQSGKSSQVNNLLDDYYLWLSQDQAVTGMQNLINTHTGEKYEETPYHTDQYGNVQESGENWVEISDDGKTITSWMFNCPKQYTMSVYGLTDGDTSTLTQVGNTDKYVATGTFNIITGYYNQRLGEELLDDNNVNEGVNEDTSYLSNYGLSGYTGTRPNTDKTAILSDGTTLTFQYWAFDEEGTQIASTDINYMYRISGNETIYAVYGIGEPDKGLTVSRNQYDYYSEAGANGKPIEYVRLNTVMNPYGYADNFHIGGNTTLSGDGIKDVAIVYVNVKNNSFDVDNLTAAQLEQLREGVQTIVQNAQNYGVTAGQQIEVTIEKTTDDSEQLSVTSENITLIANGFKYQVVTKEDAGNNTNQVYLTTKNRVQFTTTFEKKQLENLRLFAFAAMRVVENGQSQWVVSDNYVDYNLSAEE